MARNDKLNTIVASALSRGSAAQVLGTGSMIIELLDFGSASSGSAETAATDMTGGLRRASARGNLCRTNDSLSERAGNAYQELAVELACFA
ncbi:hypothetical protein ACFIOY_18245 [Bradyrhizobium sp. TZ2]